MTKFKLKITNILPEFKFKKIIQVLMIIQYFYMALLLIFIIIK